jgi:GH24 family phage-related lysozyme (muramidase)
VQLENDNRTLQSALEKHFGVPSPESIAVPVPAPEPLISKRRSRAKKGDGQEAIKKLNGSEKLPPHEVARLRKEARMARNRASAERTRQRRLAATNLLQVEVTRLEIIQTKMLEVLSTSLASCQDGATKKIGQEILVNLVKNKQIANACENFEVFSCNTRNEAGPARSYYILSPYILLLVNRFLLCRGILVSHNSGAVKCLYSLNLLVSLYHQIKVNSYVSMLLFTRFLRLYIYYRSLQLIFCWLFIIWRNPQQPHAFVQNDVSSLKQNNMVIFSFQIFRLHEDARYLSRQI